MRAELGFAIDGEHIQRVLGGRRSTTHFDIFYPRSLPPQDVELLAQDHEFRYAQLCRTLKIEGPRRIRSYVFESAKQKQRLMGAGRTLIAKPWRNEIYVQRMRFPHRVLKHELAHLFAGQFGDRVFGVSVRWQARPIPLPAPVISIDGFSMSRLRGSLIPSLLVSRPQRSTHDLI